ncbi:E3 ubiquitin ligase BIG BROTHER-related-like [Glycine soja]|uniref:E3 ubiquitin ligase BIG BROTHER-related isoform A n=1 Tax=Glycine soja TaxID=3848 RepID=A0A445IU52_GLYSO|nr:E3 ubiquitin ligase BIG BROTHER-related-like [Glycine soja]RZB89592.1 E3 ubiquitin ligase BIG BROTHER-related isoform A [Glycine soja]
MENDTAAAAANNNTTAAAAAKAGSGGVKSNNHNLEEEHSNLNGEEQMAEQVEAEEEEEEEDRQADEGEGEETGSAAPNPRQPSRTPFTNLSQVDADLALARTLQEQERAYMMLRMNNDGSDYGSWEGGSYLHDDGDDFDDLHDGTDVDEDEDEDDDEDDENEEYEDEDAFDAHAHASAGEHDNPSIEFDPDLFSSDEAYARALQEAEEREMAVRLLALAGINDREEEDIEEHGANSQDAWEDVDPDELSYEELLALSEVVGTESRGLSTDTIACLPSVNYKTGSDQHGSHDSCVICRVDYEDGESLTVLSCKHLYHPECINNWLKINKVCPVCSTEVSASGSNL